MYRKDQYQYIQCPLPSEIVALQNTYMLPLDCNHERSLPQEKLTSHPPPFAKNKRTVSSCPFDPAQYSAVDMSSSPSSWVCTPYSNSAPTASGCPFKAAKLSAVDLRDSFAWTSPPRSNSTLTMSPCHTLVALPRRGLEH